MSHLETEMMLKGYGLTTAEFFYHMPDYTHVLNSFIWQEYDLAPDHPRLFQFGTVHPSLDAGVGRMAQREGRIHTALTGR